MTEFQFSVSYICPECTERQSIILNSLGSNIEHTKALWCPKCQARHKIQYLLNKKNKFKLVEFVCNDEIHARRFRVEA